MGQTNRAVLDKLDSLELTLEILSFSGGENTISSDQAMKVNEAKRCENWDADSLGSMIRSRGFNEVADGGATYTDAPDLLIQHQDAGGTQLYSVVEGDITYKDSAVITQDDNGAFTSGVLCHGVSHENGKLWITNSTDGLKMKAVGVAVAVPDDVPPSECARIYKHKNRLTAEGSADYPNRVYGSRTGSGNWTAADAWDLANDAWSLDLPDATQGCVPDFPSGNEILVFTKTNAYALSNFPNTAFRAIGTPARGCSAPYSIAKGDEGVYFLSERPTLGVFLFDGVQFKELTELNRDVFVEKVDFSKRIFGIYRDHKYYVFYNEIGSGVSYPNTLRVYDAKFGRWMERVNNATLADNFGYPALLNYSNFELYAASSRKDKIYELETDDNSDEGNDTEAVYDTKVFSSRDFAISSGGQFPIDDVKLKLVKGIVTYYGTVGALTLQWTADRGLHSGSKTVSLTATGDLINSTFQVNTSSVITTPQEKTVSFTFSNDAVGRRFQLQVANSGSSTRPIVKKIKLIAVAVDEA